MTLAGWRYALSALLCISSCFVADRATALPRGALGVAATEPLLFASSVDGVYAFPLKGDAQQPLWYLSGSPLTGPTGISVDGQRNLYVSDGSGYVYEYDRPRADAPPGAPSFAYYDPEGPPQSVTACEGGGKHYVYAANDAYMSSSFYTSFTVWVKGKTNPVLVVSNPNYYESEPIDVDCDPQGNFYFGYQSPSNFVAAIDEYVPGGSGSPTTIAVSFGYFAEAFGIGAHDVMAAIAAGYYSDPIEIWREEKGTWVYRYSVGIALGSTGCQGPVAFERENTAFWIVDYCSSEVLRMELHGRVVDSVAFPQNSYLESLATSPSNRP